MVISYLFRIYFVRIIILCYCYDILGLNGKFGAELQQNYPNMKIIKDFQTLTVNELNNIYHNIDISNRLHQLLQGIDNELITFRSLPKSIGCGKSFTYKNKLTYQSLINNDIKNWVNELSSELYERTNEDLLLNNRQSQQLVVGISIAMLSTQLNHNSVNNHWHEGNISLSKAIKIIPNSIEIISFNAYNIVTKLISSSPKITSNQWVITYISMSTTSFVSIVDNNQSIKSYFKTTLNSNNSVCETHINDSELINDSMFIGDRMIDENEIDINKNKLEDSNIQIFELNESIEENEKEIIEIEDSEIIIIDTSNHSINTSILTSTLTTTTMTPSMTTKKSNSIVSTLPNMFKSIKNSQQTNNNTNNKEIIQFQPKTMDEIDEEIFKTLPKDIQDEILLQMYQTTNNNNHNNTPNNKRSIMNSTQKSLKK